MTSTRSSVPCRLTPRDKHVRMGSKWLCSQQQNGTTAPRQRDHERRKGENHAIVPRREVPTSAMMISDRETIRPALKAKIWENFAFKIEILNNLSKIGSLTRAVRT